MKNPLPILIIPSLLIILIFSLFLQFQVHFPLASSDKTSLAIILYPYIGSLAGIIPMFLALGSLSLLLYFLGSSGWILPNVNVSKLYPILLFSISTFTIVLLNTFQISLNHWIPTGWDTPDLLWQPNLYNQHNVYNLLHFGFPNNPYFPSSGSPSSGSGPGYVDSPPLLLMFLQLLYTLFPSHALFPSSLPHLEILNALNLLLIFGCSVSVFLLAKSITQNLLLASVSSVFFSLGSGFYLLEWGSMQNLACLTILNFATCCLLSKSKFYYLSFPLFLIAIFTHDVGILFTGAFLTFLIAWNLPEIIKVREIPSGLIRTLLPLLVAFVLSLPYEIFLLHSRGDLSPLRITNAGYYILSFSDYIISSTGIIFLAILGVIISLRYFSKSANYSHQILLAYFLFPFILSLPWFFTVQFRFLWMMVIPTSILASLAIIPILNRKNLLRFFVLILILSQAVFALNFYSLTFQNAGGYGFPGPYIQSSDLQAIEVLSHIVGGPTTLVLSPNQYASWIIGLTGSRTSYMDGNTNSSLQAFIDLYNTTYHTFIFANSNSPILLDYGFAHNQLIWNNSWDFIFVVS